MRSLKLPPVFCAMSKKEAISLFFGFLGTLETLLLLMNMLGWLCEHSNITCKGLSQPKRSKDNQASLSSKHWIAHSRKSNSNNPVYMFFVMLFVTYWQPLDNFDCNVPLLSENISHILFVRWFRRFQSISGWQYATIKFMEENINPSFVKATGKCSVLGGI